jgi:hypothetical protein
MKNHLLSGLLGAIIAVAINYGVILGAICLGWKNSYESPCVPELIKILHSDTMAVIVQTIIVIVIGFLIGAFTAKVK